LFVLIGLGLLAAAAMLAIRTWDFLHEAAAAPGIVVALLAGGSHPQIEFTTASGRKVTYAQGGFIFGYRAGERVTVLYRPDRPDQTACIDAAGALWFSSVILGFIGLACLVGGL
jgi:hypothetical protein